jgi:hypothetical protein
MNVKSQKEINLIRRYLIWCYKTTKEDLDRIDRYFTQLEVDDFILRELKKDKSFLKSSPEDYAKHVADFAQYMETKKQNVLKKKFSDDKFTKLRSEYLYLHNRFRAIEKAIVYFLGKAQLQKITDLYEAEMSRRILQATEH